MFLKVLRQIRAVHNRKILRKQLMVGGKAQPAVAVDGIDDVEQEIASGQAVVSKGLLSIYA